MDVNNEDKKNMLFVSDFFSTKKEITEFANRIVFRNIALACYTVSIVAILVGLWLGRINLIVGFVVAGAVLLNLQIVKYRVIKKAHKTAVLKKDGDTQRVFCGDAFGLNGEMYGYGQISKIVVARLCMYIYISTEKYPVVMVKKDAFTVGDYESFVAFIEEKTALKILSLRKERTIELAAIFVLIALICFSIFTILQPQ